LKFAHGTQIIECGETDRVISSSWCWSGWQQLMQLW